MNRADRRKTAKTNKERIDEYIEAGEAIMLQGGDPREARRLFRQVLALDPGDAGGNLNLGMFEMMEGKLSAAQQQFERALKRDPKDPRILNNLGIALHRQGGVVEAQALYQKVLALDPGNMQAHVNMARAFVDTNKPQEALAEAKKAADLSPENGGVQFLLGSIAVTIGQDELARGAFQKTVDLVPGHREANFRLCRMNYDPADPEGYLKSSRDAFEANRDNAEVATGWAEILFSIDKFEEAQDAVQPHLESGSPLARSSANNAMAHSCVNSGDYDGAIEWHKKALAAAPDNASTRLFYGRTLLRSGDSKGAYEQFSKALPQMPLSQDLVAMLMMSQKLNGETEAIESDVANIIRVVELQPKEVYSSAEEMNKTVLGALAKIEKTRVHPFDNNRRLADEIWDRVLSRQDVEPLAMLGEMLQHQMTGYVADMPDDVRNHPMLGRKPFGIGDASGTYAEAVNNFDDFSYAIDQRGWFRMVYFLDVPAVCDDEDKKAGWMRFGVPHFKDMADQKPDREIKPVVGQTIIFPAYYWYGFNALKADKDLSFVSVLVQNSGG